jgi:DNA-binding MarR family transcriptional regulator
MAPTRWLDPQEERAWRSWLAMTERVRSQVARDLMADSGLSDADYMVLVNLSEADGQRIRLTELAARLNWSKSRLSHQLDRMQARGLVRREHCPSDARGTFAVLDPCGLAEIEAAAPKHVESVRRHLIDVLDAAQLGQLAAIADQVLQRLCDGKTGSEAEEACTEAAEACTEAEEVCTEAGEACTEAGEADELAAGTC